MKKLIFASALWALFASSAWALYTSKLKPTGYVNDFARAIDPASAQALEAYAGDLERATGVQMAIVTVDSLEDEPIEDVANRLYREWGIGKKGKDEGILLLLAIKDRKSRAEVGYGLEPIITDGDAGGILRGVQPILRQGNYGGALFAAAQEIGTQIAQSKGVQLDGGTPIAAAPMRRPTPHIPWFLIVLGIFFLLRLFGGRGSGGGGTGFLTGMFLGNMMGRSGGWGGGGFGGYSGGWGGGGGFGGFGGGDSGGGGASGGW